MKQVLFCLFCVFLLLYLLPSGMASWEIPLTIGGSVNVVEPEADTFNLTIIVGGAGTTNPEAGTYVIEEGETITLIAYPNQRWEFEKWIFTGGHWALSGEHVEVYSEVSFQMASDIEAVAVFVESAGTVEDTETGNEKDNQENQGDGKNGKDRVVDDKEAEENEEDNGDIGNDEEEPLTGDGESGHEDSVDEKSSAQDEGSIEKKSSSNSNGEYSEDGFGDSENTE